jgi:hypothetical protein
MDELTPLRAVEDVTETAAFGVTGALPRLATPTMDLTPLGARAGAEPSPAPSPAPGPAPSKSGASPRTASRVASRLAAASTRRCSTRRTSSPPR